MVQLRFHPALLAQRRSPLSDPLFELGRGDSLLPELGDARERASAAPGSSFGNDVTPVSLGPIPALDAVHFLVSRAPPDVPIEEERTADLEARFNAGVAAEPNGAPPGL